jgi:hypothetical protein
MQATRLPEQRCSVEPVAQNEVFDLIDVSNIQSIRKGEQNIADVTAKLRSLNPIQTL